MRWQSPYNETGASALRVFKLQTGRCMSRDFTGEAGGVCFCEAPEAIKMAGTIIGSASYDGTVRLWSVTGKCLKILEGSMLWEIAAELFQALGGEVADSSFRCPSLDNPNDQTKQVLHQRQFPLSERLGAVPERYQGINNQELVLLASERSAGKALTTAYGEKQVEAFSVERAQSCDIVLMAVSGGFSTEYSPQIVANGKTIVIDNSSAFRYKDDIPLVVPEINSDAMKGKLLIANPNCTTAIAAMALWPLHKRFRLRKVIVSTYQAASGAGAAGMTELEEGTRQALENQTHANEVFAHPLPFNVIPHIDAFQSNGYTKAGFCSSVSAEYRILNGFQCCSQAFLITFTA
ncbi:asd [Symbiodinium sp. KB8]|nr:asd [Symbiodinium sp. KB8]